MRSSGSKKKNRNWTTSQLEKALAAIDNDMPVRFATKEQDILSSTLRGHVYGTILYRKRGRNACALSEAEEKDLIQYLMKIQEL